MSTNKNSPDTNRQVARSAGLIGLATLASRILGFLRDVVIARLFGVYLYSQAFVIAFKLPNLLRDLVAEGAANAAVIPVLSEYQARRSKEEFWQLANTLLSVLLVALAALTLLGIVFSPWLVRLIAPGFASDPEKFLVTVRLNRLIFPYIMLIGLSAYAAAMLNSLRHFAVPAFAPCLLNIAIIVCALVWGEGVKGLALGVLIGGLLQLAVQLPVLYRKGFRFSWRFSLKHPAVRQVGRLLTPRLFSSAIYQLNNFVDTIFGSLSMFVGEGAVAALYFSYRLVQFPIGIFSNALAQAILPALSCQALETDKAPLKRTLVFGLRSILFLMIPASIGFIVLARPIISALFQGGKFDSYSVETTASALMFYSIGLFAYGANRILQCGFFALKDTMTPTKIAGLGLVLNIVLNALLMFPMKLAGLALATSLSGIICFFVSFWQLQKKTGGLRMAEQAGFILKVVLASGSMGLVCSLLSRYALIVPIAAGMAVFFGLSALLKLEEPGKVFSFVLSRGR